MIVAQPQILTTGNPSFGIRKEILMILRESLENIVIYPGPPPTILKVGHTYIDPLQERSQLPKAIIIPDPETIKVGLFGVTKDRTMRVNILAYVIDRPLFDACEDVIAIIVNTLTTIANATYFIEKGFSIVEIGPIIAEQMETDGETGYVSVPLTVQFLLDQC